MTISIPDTLTSDNSIDYILSIRLSPGGLSFSLYHSKKNTSFFKEISFEAGTSYISFLKELFFENEFFSYVYKEVYVLSVTSRYTLIPTSLFKEKEKKRLTDFLFTNEFYSLHTTFADEKIEILYSMEEECHQFCARSLINPVFIPHSLPLLIFCRKNSLISSLKHIYILIENKRVDILCYQAGHLVFANSYLWQADTDIIYLILHVWKQQHMNQQSDQLYFLGAGTFYQSLRKVISRYIKNINNISVPFTNYLPEQNLERVPFDLMALSVCEL
ncbi:MAG: DUF3822 family protein [Tannerellaceae bacterium]|nr:DUF3822 family protein [Tannerellaceae bacterium]